MNITDSILKRIKKLLTLAQNRGATEAEAQNAMAMAQRLMTKYNISMASVGDTPQEGIRHETYFSRKGSLNPADKEISFILRRFYKVRVLVNNAKELVLVGSPSDIEIAKYVHGYLRKVFFKCWNEYKNGKPYAVKADYYFGLRTGIQEKMEIAEKQAKSEASQASCQKYELVLAESKEAIIRYISGTFGKLNRGRHHRCRDGESFSAGRVKGNTLQINPAIKD